MLDPLVFLNVRRSGFAKKTIGSAALALAIAFGPIAPSSAEEGVHQVERPPVQSWSFAGAFGRYDKAQLRRGLKVYREVCSSCHSLKMIAFRNLGEPGGPELSPAEVLSIAESYKIKDGPNDAGDMFERPGRLSDRFPPPFPNEQAARAALAGAYPPDMSVLAKARGYSRGFPTFLFDVIPGLSYQEQGVDYIAALLGGYRDAPHGVTLAPGQYYNIYMPGRRTGMPPPLADGAVTYEDGSPQTADQYAKDVSAFLMWAAEPHLDDRKRVGLGVVAFLAVFGVMIFFTKRRIWSNVH